MNFKNWQNRSDTELTESKKIRFSTVQPTVGKPAVDIDGLKIDGSAVLGEGLVAVIGPFGPGDQIDIFDVRSGKLMVSLPNDAPKTLRKLK